jgi:peptidyl-dipeptidase Dcp
MHRRTFLAASAATGATTILPVNALAQSSTNPLLAPWTGPFGGVPAFDKVRVADFKPALEAAMAEELREVEAIANNPAPATFENTIAALERSGRVGNRVQTYYGIWNATLSTPELRAIQKELDPKLQAHADRIVQNEKLFRRIEQVYEHRDHLNLTPEQKRLVWLRWNGFVRAGAKLSPEAKARVAAINEELAGHYTSFNQNLLHDENERDLFLKETDLAGLPADVRAAMGAAAAEKKRAGEFVIVNTRSSVDPFLTYSARRDLREKVWRTFYSRGDNGDAWDNNAGIRKILKLRAE